MLFNSTEFLLFLPVVFLLYWFVFNKNLIRQNLLILTASYFFYGWWSWKFLLLLILSTLLDYLYGFGVATANRRKSKLFLWLSIINNFGILAIFKYYNFFAIEFQQVFDIVGVHFNPVLIQVVLPLGISFYTFHGMSYVFDIYRGIREPVTGFIDYAVFVCFFPLLVAGPIERANHLLPQVQKKRVFNYIQAVEGCRLILWGMFKKIVIADSLAVVVNDIFNRPHSQNAFALITGAVGFSFQIYADFSGYSDIAIGTAKLLGFELFSNFRFPYFSRDVAEFWRRWHISLSSWFRDYLYIPLGGSKKGKPAAVRNIFIVFLVSGLWHGAGWNFLVWGGIHACGFLPLLLLNKNRRHAAAIVAADSKLPTLKELFQIIGTFVFVTFAWIFFRIHSVQKGIDYIKKIVIDSMLHPGQYLHRPKGASVVLYIMPFILIDWYIRRNERCIRMPKVHKAVRFIIYLVMFKCCIDKFMIRESETLTQNFIYFKF